MTKEALDRFLAAIYIAWKAVLAEEVRLYWTCAYYVTPEEQLKGRQRHGYQAILTKHGYKTEEALLDEVCEKYSEWLP